MFPACNTGTSSDALSNARLRTQQLDGIASLLRAFDIRRERDELADGVDEQERDNQSGQHSPGPNQRGRAVRQGFKGVRRSDDVFHVVSKA